MSKVFIVFRWVRKHWCVSAVLLIVGYVGVSKTIEYSAPPKEIALIIGEPWKDMQARSTARIGDDIPGEIWFRQPKDLAYLRFADPQYGFTTPPAKFFAIGFNRGRVDRIRLSPQTEPLPLEDALDIILNLQNQWRSSGWDLDDPENYPAYENNQFWIEELKNCDAGTTHWDAGQIYQLVVIATCFKDERHPNEQRYLVTLAVGPFDKELERPFRKQ